MTVFSQTVTKNTINRDSSKVSLTKPVAKAVVSDLIRGDEAIATLNLIRQNNDTLINSLYQKDRLLSIKDSIIYLQKEKEFNYQGIINIQKEQIKDCENLSKKFEKDLKKSIRQKTISNTLLGTVIVVLATILIIK